MEYILTGAEMAACDRRTSEVIGIPSLVLMERAALSVADGAEAFFMKKGAVAGNGRTSCGRLPASPQGGRRGRILVVSGRGNNGADALAAGRMLLDRGFDVRFCRLSGPVPPDSSFAVQAHILDQYGAEVSLFTEMQRPLLDAGDACGEGGCAGRVDAPADGMGPAHCPKGSFLPALPDLVIDGLFGTGLSRPLSGEAALAVAWINRLREAGAYVVAVDIPSGVSSEDGRVMGCAVRCDETRTFAFCKRGHLLYPGAAFAGRIHLAQIGITARAFASVPGMFAMSGERAAGLVPLRDPNGNKGTFGKILIVAGRRNMCGAALLAAGACMAAGAGMVKVYTHDANRLIVQGRIPEALLGTWSEDVPDRQIVEDYRRSLEWADVVALGPGLGTDAYGRLFLREMLRFAREGRGGEVHGSLPSAGQGDPPPGPAPAQGPAQGGGARLRGLVLDADALRILARDRELAQMLAGRPDGLPCILTPHLAEFADLAGARVEDLKAGRAEAVQALADRLCCTVACKDARTIVAAPVQPARRRHAGRSAQVGSAAPALPLPLYINRSGNSGMATAGSGDVLTGMAAALLAAFTAAPGSGREPGPSGFSLAFARLLSLPGISGACPQADALPEISGACPQADTLPGISGACPQADALPGISGACPQADALPGGGGHLPADFEAACTAVYLHGLAGDAARDARGGQGMAAGDIARALRSRAFWEG